MWDLPVTYYCVTNYSIVLKTPVIGYVLEFPELARQSLRFTWCSPGSLMWLDVQDGFSHLTGAAIMTRGQAGLSPLLHVISSFLNSSAKASLNGGWILRKHRSYPDS